MLRRALSDDRWTRIATLVPGKVCASDRTAGHHRLFVEGVVWLARHAGSWRAFPEEFGPWNSAFIRFNHWAWAGVWDRVFCDVSRDVNCAHAIIDGTIVRGHQHANSGSRRTKKGLRVRLSDDVAAV